MTFIDKVEYKFWKHLNKKMLSNMMYQKKKNFLKNTAQNHRNNVFVSGLGWSGASAIIDFFNNYTDTAVVNYEFDIFRTPPWHINEVSGPMDIIRKFSANEDITDDIKSFQSFYYLLGIHWYNDFGNQYFDTLDRLCHLMLNFQNTYRDCITRTPNRSSELPVWTNRLTNIVAETWGTLLDMYQPEKSLGVFEHGIRTWEKIEDQLMFLPDTLKFIVSYRDPRDSWADMVSRKDWFQKHGVPLEKFISDRNRVYKNMQTNSQRVMHIRFENLCLNTDTWTKKNNRLCWIGQ